ncbi:Bromodomain containing protein [Histomonas meleagridis]|uniref:Bromodomain containing protein n=1 Tax=Histomonas meleagridis TaxID=135588 RepID=UPI00355ACD36|nr:Bromodomain containing protein [Histomonas meleagridis]KAH0803704.1 Bromodomain containing protein [Histomonas meleagridis]
MKKVESLPHELWVNTYLQAQSELCQLFGSQPSPYLDKFNLSPDMEMLVPERKVARSWLTPEDTKLISESFRYVDDPQQLSKLLHILQENEPTIDFNEDDLKINLSALSQRTIRLLKTLATEIKDPPVIKHSISVTSDMASNA